MSFHLVHTLTDSQIVDLHALYQQAWWSQERSLEDVRLMVAGSSLLFGFVTEEGRLIAFCRLLTDFVFRAVLHDVIVDETWRGTGLGKQLMDRVSAHPRLERVSTVWLACLPEMIPFYERWGFEVSRDEQVWMSKIQRPGS